MPRSATRNRSQQPASDLTISLPLLHAGQQKVYTELKRHNFLVAGRRWRKTTFAMDLMVERALERPAEYVWSAPTYKQVRVGWDEMRRGCLGVFRFNESLMQASLPNGSLIHFLSLKEYDNTRGLTSFGTVIDEASEVHAEAYSKILRPQLFGTDGWLLAMGTPKGRNWFCVEHERVLAGDRPDAATWQIPTMGARIQDGQLIREPHAYENPSFAFEELELEYKSLPERVFRQEYLAEFLDDAGGVFRGVDRCIAGALQSAPTARTARYVIGVDLAKHQDYTVCVVVDLQKRQVVAFDRWNQADWVLQKARIAALAKHWNDALVWMDSTGVGDPIFDDLHHAGLRIHPYTFTSASKTALINNAVLQVEQQQIAFPRIDVLVAELKAYEYQPSPSGRLTMNAPEGMHDDCVVAFSLACWPLQHGATAHLDLEQIEATRQPVTSIGGVKILRKTF